MNIQIIYIAFIIEEYSTISTQKI